MYMDIKIYKKMYATVRKIRMLLLQIEKNKVDLNFTNFSTDSRFCKIKISLTRSFRFFLDSLLIRLLPFRSTWLKSRDRRAESVMN